MQTPLHDWNKTGHMLGRLPLGFPCLEFSLQKIHLIHAFCAYLSIGTANANSDFCKINFIKQH